MLTLIALVGIPELHTPETDTWKWICTVALIPLVQVLWNRWFTTKGDIAQEKLLALSGQVKALTDQNKALATANEKMESRVHECEKDHAELKAEYRTWSREVDRVWPR